jgi:hypothetical protein
LKSSHSTGLLFRKFFNLFLDFTRIHFIHAT